MPSFDNLSLLNFAVAHPDKKKIDKMIKTLIKYFIKYGDIVRPLAGLSPDLNVVSIKYINNQCYQCDYEYYGHNGAGAPAGL